MTTTKIKKTSMMGLIKKGMYFILILFSLYLFLAWTTYSPFDPSWTVSSSRSLIINQAGSVGAWIIDFLYVFVGYVTNIIPFILLVIAFYGYFYKNHNAHSSELKIFLNLLGIISLILGATLLFALFYIKQPISYYLPGGILGGILLKNLALIFKNIYILYGISFILISLGFVLFSGWKLIPFIISSYHWLMLTSDEKELASHSNNTEIKKEITNDIILNESEEPNKMDDISDNHNDAEKIKPTIHGIPVKSKNIEPIKSTDETENISQTSPLKVDDQISNSLALADCNQKLSPTEHLETSMIDNTVTSEKSDESDIQVASRMPQVRVNSINKSNSLKQNNNFKRSIVNNNLSRVAKVAKAPNINTFNYNKTEEVESNHSLPNVALQQKGINKIPASNSLTQNTMSYNNGIHIPAVHLAKKNLEENIKDKGLLEENQNIKESPKEVVEDIIAPSVSIPSNNKFDAHDSEKLDDVGSLEKNTIPEKQEDNTALEVEHTIISDNYDDEVMEDPELKVLAQQFTAQENARLAELQKRAKEIDAEDTLDKILETSDEYYDENVESLTATANTIKDDQLNHQDDLSHDYAENTQIFRGNISQDDIPSHHIENTEVAKNNSLNTQNLLPEAGKTLNQQEKDTQMKKPLYSNYGNTLIHPALQQAMPVMEKPTTPLPTIDLLDEHPVTEQDITEDSIQTTSNRIEKLLKDFNVRANVKEVLVGPVVTRYDLELQPGVKAAKVTGLEGDLARALLFPAIRVAEVIPGKPYVGIETPNETRQTVYLRDVLDSDEFRSAKSPLSMALGKDISGNPIVVDLASMPHLLVAGATGSGKSVGVNTMILSLLYRVKPEEVKFIMIDPKVVELSVYNGIPHLLTEVVTDMKKAANALRWCVNEMERRYQLLSALNVRNIENYNEQVEKYNNMGMPIPDPLWRPGDTMDTMPPPLEKLSYIVVIVDEFADLMMVAGKEVEELIARLAQKARAIGIHLILATQRPSVDVITGLIKANVPTRIAFSVASKIDSRTILDQGGAEALLGRGDMLYSGKDSSDLVRVHGAFMTDEEVVRVANDWRARGKPNYIESILESSNDEGNEDSSNKSDSDELDELFDEVMEFVITTGNTSTSYIQRKFKVGFNRAARIMDQLEEEGIVSSLKNGKRELLARKYDY